MNRAFIYGQLLRYNHFLESMESIQSISPSIIPVAHLVIALNNGGLEHLVMRWTAYRNQLSEGSTHIICLDEFGTLASKFQGGDVHCINAKRSKFPWDRQAVNRLSQLLKELNIAVVHSHNSAAHLYGVLATLKTKTSHMQTQHGMNIHDSGFKATLLNRVLRFFTPKYVAVSKEVADNLQRKHGVPADRVHFVANGVEEHRSTSTEVLQQLRKDYRIPPDAFILGSAGRLAAVKGWDRFFPIFAKIIEENTNGKPLHLLLVGSGPEQNKLQNMARKLGIENNLSFAGFQQDCHPYYDLIDLFIMPSRSEGLSVSLLEAMQPGCPVAVTAVGEHTRLVEVSGGGILMETNNPESWVKTLFDFIQDTNKQNSCGLKGQTHVKSHYTLENTYQSYEALYRSLLVEKSRE